MSDTNFILPLEAAERVADQLDFAKSKLLPAIAIQYDSNEVLMQAWMNRAAVIDTLTTGRVCYYSRSKQGLWRKGDTSGHVQHLKGMRIDCDKDSILLLVDQVGAACHTMRRHCFFYEAQDDGSLDIINTSS